MSDPNALTESGANTAVSPQRTRGLRPPWRKGESGNPKGRPPNPYHEAIVRELKPEEFAKIIGERARRGDARVLVALLERHYPRPDVAMKIESLGRDGYPIRAEIVVEYVEPSAE